jgi:ribosomal protein S27AE
MRVSEHRYSRDLRRLDLAARMARLGARTGQVCRWAGLNKRRVQNLLTLSIGITGDDDNLRPRGSSPRRLVPMFRTATRRSEASALAILCGHFGALPTERGDKAVRDLPTVHRGECLCAAFEAYLALVPEPTLTLDHAILLVASIVKHDDIDVERCAICGGVVLAHRWRRDRLICGACNDSSLAVPAALSDAAAEGLFAVDRGFDAEPVQRSLF